VSDAVPLTETCNPILQQPPFVSRIRIIHFAYFIPHIYPRAPTCEPGNSTDDDDDGENDDDDGDGDADEEEEDDDDDTDTGKKVNCWIGAG